MARKEAERIDVGRIGKTRQDEFVTLLVQFRIALQVRQTVDSLKINENLYLKCIQ